jgi:hypothetical protein
VRGGGEKEDKRSISEFFTEGMFYYVTSDARNIKKQRGVRTGGFFWNSFYTQIDS